MPITQQVNGLLQVTPSVPTGTFRQQVLGNVDYWVSPSGSDLNTGLTSGTPFKTVQQALNIAAAFDYSIYNLTVHVADGNYSGTVALPQMIGAGTFTLIGNPTSPSSCVFSTSTPNNYTLYVQNACVWHVNGFKVLNGINYGMIALNFGVIYFQNMDFGLCGFAHMAASSGGQLLAEGNYSISASASGYHTFASFGGLVQAFSKTLNIIANLTFSVFANSNYLGALDYRSATINLNGNTVTATRYNAIMNAIILSGNGSATFFPGNVAGTTSTGGQYL